VNVHAGLIDGWAQQRRNLSRDADDRDVLDKTGELPERAASTGRRSTGDAAASHVRTDDGDTPGRYRLEAAERQTGDALHYVGDARRNEAAGELVGCQRGDGDLLEIRRQRPGTH
jgi:hypothetical protein